MLPSTASSTTDSSAQEASAPSRQARFTLPETAPINRMLAEPAEPLDFVLPGLLRSTVGAIIGMGGVGKSIWAMQLAVSMATGVDLVGLRPSKGRVLYLSAEDSEQVLTHRLKDMTAGAPKGLDLGARLDLRVLEDAVDIMIEEWLAVLVRAAKGFDVVVLDTLTRFHNLDENSAKDMKQLMAQLERLARLSGAAVVYVHHTNKGAVNAGLAGSQQAARGSSVLVDNARWSCFLAAMTPAEARKFEVPEDNISNYVRWNISKQNYAAGIPDIWYHRGAGGILRHNNFPMGKAPFKELIASPTDRGGKSIRHIRAKSTGLPAVIRADDPDSVIARGLPADSTMQERAAHARAMESTANRAPKMSVGRPGSPNLPSANNAYDGNW